MKTKAIVWGLAALLGCAGDDGNASTTAMTFATTMASSADDGPTDGDDGDGSADGDDGSDAPTGDGSGDAGTADDGPGDDGPADTSADGSDDGVDPPGPPVCQHQCTVPQDCFIDGNETGLGCNAGMCSIACTDDPTCVAAASGWTLIPCDSTAECADGGGVCVDTGGGVGGCSLIPAQGPCSGANLVEMPATTVEGNAVTVCGQPDAICIEFGDINACIVSCVGNPCAGELTCESDGLCHCDYDTQCVDVGLGNNCNADGLCEFACQTPDNCPAHPFDGGQVVCE